MTSSTAGTARLRVGVVDYGAGNLVSIRRALEILGASVELMPDATAMGRIDALVVPGVGAAAPAMERLDRRGLTDPIRDWARAGRPFLGICLGLQLLMDGSDEDGAVTLGLLAGRTVALRDAPTLPHIGWNQVERRSEHPILDGVPDGADLYFVHSYVAAPDDPAVVLAETTHGRPFASVVADDALIGVQFHPERSGPDGLRVLANFLAIAAGSTQMAPTALASAAAPGPGPLHGRLD